MAKEEKIYLYFEENNQLHCEIHGNPNVLLNMLASATASVIKYASKDNNIATVLPTPHIVAEFGKTVLAKLVEEQDEDA